MKQAIIYTRFSPRPNAKDCLSCEYQLERCQDFCKFKQLDILAHYEDKAISGKNITDREGFRKALAHVLSLKEDGILVVYNLSRMARSTLDAINICQRLKKAKCDLAIVTEQIDTSTPMGRALFKMMAIFAELTREATSDETSVRLKHMQSKGIRVSDQTPYGWMVDPNDKKRIVINPNEQQMLKLILRMHIRDNLNAFRITKALNNLGYKARNNRPFGHPLIYKIIERYVGKDKQILNIDIDLH
jgi:site-specific DNA recombinase